MYTTIRELSHENQNEDGLWDLISILVVYMDPLGLGGFRGS